MTRSQRSYPLDPSSGNEIAVAVATVRAAGGTPKVCQPSPFSLELPTHPEGPSFRTTGSFVDCQMSCRRRTPLAVIFLVMLCTAGVVSAESRSSCEIASLATNIRLFCSGNHPSSLCCDSVTADVAGEDDKQCLCLVGNSPEIMTMGFSTENLIRLHSLCTQHDDDFGCDGDSDISELENDMSRGKESAAGDNAYEDPPRKRNHRRETHKSDTKDDDSETKQVSAEENDHEEVIYPHNQRRDNISEQHVDQQPQQREQSADSHTSSSTIGVLSGVIVLLVMILVAAVAVKYKRQQTELQQLLSVALAAALPPVRTHGAVVDPPPVPVQAPPPALVNGIPVHPVPPVEPAPPLAFFPGPAEILSLLGYIALDRVRRRVAV